MREVDNWLAEAALATRGSDDDLDMARLRRSLVADAARAGQGPVLVWSDVRTAMLCAGLAALLAFAGLDTLAGRTWNKPAATWLATPPAVSPFGLLVGP